MPKRQNVFVLAALAAGLTACSAGPGTVLRVATGAVSSFVCLGTFGSGEVPERVYADTFQPVPAFGLIDWALHYEVDRAQRSVRTTFAGGFETRAVYRDDLGCLMISDGALPPLASPPAQGTALLPEIGGAEVVASGDPRLMAAIDRSFVEPDQPPFRRTKAVVVLHDGKVIAERYAPGYGVDTPILGNSLTKSVSNALIGILVRDGKLAVDAPAPVAAWQAAGDPRRAITVEQLMRMQSGLDLGDSSQAALSSLWTPSNRMLFLERDMAGFAAGAALAAPPGASWTYADGSYLILSRIIRDAVGGNAAAVRDFAERELFGPLGMRHVILGFDATGTPVAANHMLAPARAWARLGQLYLQDGAVGGRRLLPAGWVDFSATATPGARIGYGAGFWTNRDTSFGAERRVGFGMPREAFFGRGMFGQFMVVVPSAKLVVVRLGTTVHGDQEAEAVSRLVAEVIAALCA